MFQSVIGYRDTCPSCNTTTIRPGEPKSALLAAIPPDAKGEPSIYDCLDSNMIHSFSKPCDKCGKDTQHESREVIKDPSEVLLVQILRFNRQDGSVRDTTPVKFPAELDITRYLDSHIAGNKADGLKYTLNGVVRHESGNTGREAGHYISYVKGPGARWCAIDNDFVQEEEDDCGALQPVEYKGKRSNTTSTPYILVYTRQPPSTTKDDITIAKEEALPPQQISSTLDLDVGPAGDDMDLPVSLHIGPHLDDFEEKVQPSRNRWDVHAVNIVLQIKAGNVPMTGISWAWSKRQSGRGP